MIDFWGIDQRCLFRQSPTCGTCGNDDVLCHEYDIKKENFLCLSAKFHVKKIYQISLQFLEFLFYS